MKKDNCEKHESEYIHIRKNGFLKGFLLLPFSLAMSIFLFPLAFIGSFIDWYSNKEEIKKYYPCFVYYLYGATREEWGIKYIKKKEE